MKKLIFTTLASAVFGLTTLSQELKEQKSIAVALPNIENIDVSREIVAKLIQIEVIKMDKYKVYDEFDMQEAMQANKKFQEDCYGKRCLAELGQEIKADYILSSSLFSFGNRIVITMKIMDINTTEIIKTNVMEFVDQKLEIQRMVRILILQMHDLGVHPEVLSKIAHDNRPIVKKDVYKVDNTGPRMGYSFFTGALQEFATRERRQGGLDIFPGATMIGYQFEKQYVGTENFSALGEILLTVSGLEQGIAIPSITLMHGVRFGKAGWEFAFGPGFGVSRMSEGFFDEQGFYGENGRYWTLQEYKHNYAIQNDYAEAPEPIYPVEEHLDIRSKTYRLNTRFVLAAGRTFQIGALNLPVNVFYSSMRNSGMVGLSIGFNVVKN
jgi:TolB-like protein